MTDPEAPDRLFDSPEAPPGLREVLKSARADVGTDAQVARLASKLGPLLGAAAPVASGAGAPTAPTASGLGAKLGLGALALLVAGGGAWLLAASNVSAPAAVPARSATPPSALPSLPRAEPAAPSVVSTSSPELASPVAPSAGKPGLPRKPLPAAVPSEAELLEQARAALKSGDNARALSRATEHAQRYPRGVLVQEREVLAIAALRRLGRSAEAERRAEAFAKAYPGSAFQRKLER